MNNLEPSALEEQLQTSNYNTYLVWSIILDLLISIKMSTLITLREYYHDLNEHFNELYFEVLKDFSVKAVHDMRVNIKKQNAFFHMLESIDPDFEATESKAVFYKIFKNAGAIRKVHIEEKLLTGLELDAKVLKKIKAQLKKNLKKCIDKFLFHNNTRSLLSIRKISPEIEKHIGEQKEIELLENLDKYFRNLIGNLKSLADASKKTKKAYHDLRKLLKELIHNFELIKKLFPDSDFSPDVLEYLDKLQADLGDWHDLYLTIKSLKKLKKPPEAIINNLRKEYDAYVQKIRTHLENYDDFSVKISNEISFLLKE